MGSQSKEEQLEEARTMEALMSVLKFDMERSGAMEAIQKRDAAYAAEMNLLPKARDMGLPQGLTAGLVSLAFFMKGNSVILKRDRGVSPFGGARPPAASAIMKLSLYTFSLSVSLANTLLVSFAFQDKEKILSRLAETLLVEGRSVLSDSFCSDVSKKYHEIHSPKYWENVKSPFLRHMGTFVHNCELRRSFENKLRKERGLMSGEPVSIPPPGVPTTINDYSGSDETGETSDFDFGQEGDTTIGDDWNDDTIMTNHENNGSDWK
jgi:hypothetical protein